MSAFYFFSEEQLKKLKLDDLLKLANYYGVNYNSKKPKEVEIINGILLAQEKYHEYAYLSPDSEPQGMSVRIRRIREQNRKEQ